VFPAICEQIPGLHCLTHREAADGDVSDMEGADRSGRAV
jgi:hypothetical protein